MTTSLARLRPGTPADTEAVVALHARCSSTTLHRRFHAPVPVVRTGLATTLLSPPGGWSVVAEHADDRITLTGLAVAGPLSATEVEVGLLVEDLHQGRGIGSRMLTEVALGAGARGYRELCCLTQPDNERLLSMVGRAGLRGRPQVADGLLEVWIPLPVQVSGLAHPA